MQRQLGYPTLFLTVAPCEWTQPYHRLVKDEALKALRTKLHVPWPEAVHAAHILIQVITGILTGVASKKWGEVYHSATYMRYCGSKILAKVLCFKR